MGTTLVMLGAWAVWIYFHIEYRVFYIILTLNLFNTMFDIAWFFDGLEMFQYTVLKNSAIKLAGVVLVFLFIKTRDDLALYILIITLSTLLGTLSMWLKIPALSRQDELAKGIPDPAASEGDNDLLHPDGRDFRLYGPRQDPLIGCDHKGNYPERVLSEQATKIIKMMEALTSPPSITCWAPESPGCSRKNGTTRSARGIRTPRTISCSWESDRRDHRHRRRTASSRCSALVPATTE